MIASMATTAAGRSRDAAIEETALRIGDGLVGVLCRPRAVQQDCALVLLNAGLVHHAGPFRVYAELARGVAAAGFPVLRFDQSGLGDSPVAAAADAGRKVCEVVAAAEAVMRETGARKVVVGGICSGADDAFQLAESVPALAGLLLIDGVAYRTPGFWARYLRSKLLDGEQLRRALRLHNGNLPGMGDFRDFPERGVAAERMHRLARVGVRSLFVFTGGAYRYFNHRGQLAACLGSAALAKTRLEYWPDSDHTFYQGRHRDRLLETIVAWMRMCFADPANATSVRDAGQADPT